MLSFGSSQVSLCLVCVCVMCVCCGQDQRVVLELWTASVCRLLPVSPWPMAVSTVTDVLPGLTESRLPSFVFCCEITIGVYWPGQARTHRCHLCHTKATVTCSLQSRGSASGPARPYVHMKDTGMLPFIYFCQLW